ncbi:MAG TPA: hypothetical protein PKB12_01330 [Elusimicrobiota bacterium]|nr:hypothetical protein [Elusimicrobiota bacterium]HMX42341.1 hypothetical protein [Elusimicrobiota bacterium]HMX93906.1 hypothetical protein [Elusimicrobiota bacterium]HNI57556.1 hypothetical protein [Elusimicrobiota bacterium]
MESNRGKKAQSMVHHSNSSRKESGQVLIGAFVVVAVLLIFVPLMVQWGKNESKWSTRDQMTMVAFNGADGAIDRGVWKLKSSTSTWAQASTGAVIAGYDFDTTYTDLPGINYRIRFSSGPSAQQVTVVAEAKDVNTGQVRAIRASFQNMAFPGGVFTGGSIGYSDDFAAHWGPVMAHGNINISGTAAGEYFPRKFSKQVVQKTGGVGNNRDTNGLNPPNTDNLEWWSDYPCPDLPVLDFTTMRASASVNSTLNYRTNDNTSGSGKCVGWTVGSHNNCRSGGATAASHYSATVCHFHDSNHHPRSKDNLIWYWDSNYDVLLTGKGTLTGHSNGIKGTMIVRGNLTIADEDNLVSTVAIPSGAWREYAAIDTAAANQYPGDTGFQSQAATFGLGTQTWTGGPASGAYSDVGILGFLYVGGNLSITAPYDHAGSIWVVGNVTTTSSERTYVFYLGNLPNVPVLNVVLVRQSWDEVRPSTATWM